MLAAISCVSVLLHAATISAQNISSQDATKFALLYGYPLLAFQRFSALSIQQGTINSISHARVLSTAADKQVVKSNDDTLYSTAVYDLSRNDVAITVPDVPSDQFALFSFYDPFGDNYANVGTGNSAGAREYRLRVRPTDSYGVELANGSSTGAENYINSPSLHGTLLVRWLINATNQDAVHSYQNATVVKPVDKANTTLLGSQIDTINWNQGNSTPASHVLNLLAQLAPPNPPEIASETDNVNANLAAAGISNGLYTKTDANLATANTSALATAAKDSTSSRTTLNNGWSIIQSNKTGDFGLDYGIRAAIGASGYLMLKAPNAVYPTWSNSTGGPGIVNLALGDDESYLYTFSAKPPVDATGFWSLTAYGADNYFIDSPQSVYALGDRSNITYPSGARVYGSGNSSNANSTQDSTFQILVQAADVPPPANWTSNWLPGPSGGGNLSALLRWYGAEAALLDGSYQYPVVTKQVAFRATVGSAENSTNGSSSGTATAPFDGGAGPGLDMSAVTAVLSAAALGIAAFV